MNQYRADTIADLLWFDFWDMFYQNCDRILILSLMFHAFTIN
jgi:hypothetical protein